MKFKFKIQQYQTDAVEAAVNVFNGQGYHDKIRYNRDLGSITPEDYQLTLGQSQADSQFSSPLGNEKTS